MAVELTILGANSAIPTISKNPTSQVLSVNQSLYLIDCAEGTQVQMRRYHVKMQRIEAVFISHMHGDHYFGLIGLLNTMSLLGRTKEIVIYGPPVLKEIIDIQLKAADTYLSFPWKFVPLRYGKSECIHEDAFASVYTIPLEHRIDCNGFKFVEKKAKRRLIKERLEYFNVPKEVRAGLKDGNDFVREDGSVIPNKQLTMDPRRTYTYAYCSDTRYTEKIVPLIKGADLLYHEATFTEAHKKRAAQTYHSTARQAALIAQTAEVKKLLIGHYSARYTDYHELLNEARETFPDTDAAVEGLVINSKEL